MTKKILTRSLVFSLLALTFACSSDDNNQNEDGFRIIPPSAPTPLIQPSGFYIANEDWYGTDKGTVNFLDYGLNRKYRIYREANNGSTLGATTTMGVAYGEHYYLVSKQDNRFAVTDKDFKIIKTFEDIQGDGRSFVGVSDTKGYISTGNGITIYHINSQTIGTKVDGINGQTGNMVYVDGKVYAAVQGKGLVIINTDTDTVIDTKAGGYTQVTLDKNGIVWAGKGSEIERINPKDTQDIKTYNIAVAPINGSWGAWNPGSMSPSMKEDAIYWTKGNKVVKFNTKTGELNDEFYELGLDDMNNKLAFYGAGLRVDPIKDDLVLLIKRPGWGSNGSYNWTRIVSNTGALKGQAFMEGGNQESSSYNDVNGYFWFPSVPFFQDNNAPEILVNQIVLKPNKEFRVALKDIVVDQDSPYNLIEKSVKNLENEFGYATIEGDELVIKTNEKTGKTSMNMKVSSNGKKLQKDVEIWVRN
ncbi:DUF5074 domain-containing protein [Myroides odoratimimus]|uniref:DUF5074 domain-containing protein n=1 Tax=Myroides odoratimimus CIP 101113 TaxID=883154 RepID=A0AAV3F8G0_9FLAO|nr:DUF5074 domain-containing protein [Myroides odoratimimus]EHO15109.1 hypothetical protein HMPREF9715_00297 [Myroides odoratimimus CIP 101113]